MSPARCWGWYGTNTDIDDLKQAQMKLRQDEKGLRQMADATQLPIIVFSAQGRPPRFEARLIAYLRKL